MKPPPKPPQINELVALVTAPVPRPSRADGWMTAQEIAAEGKPPICLSTTRMRLRKLLANGLVERCEASGRTGARISYWRPVRQGKP